MQREAEPSQAAPSQSQLAGPAAAPQNAEDLEVQLEAVLQILTERSVVSDVRFGHQSSTRQAWPPYPMRSC